MALIGEKSALGSLGVWGSLISLLPAVFEVVIHVTDTAASSGALGAHGVVIAAAVGGLISLFGRVNAKKEITSLLPKE